MNKERKKLYDKLRKKIGNTPLKKYSGKVPNGNQIFIKMECENLFGSHYDRVYLALFEKYEKEGRIKPGDKVIETSSGSAGISFAGIGKFLGYDCYVVLPRGGEKAREEAIIKQLPDKNHLILTPAKDYVNAFPKFIKDFLSENKDYFFLNHSMNGKDKYGNPKNNETTIGSLSKIATESLKEVKVDFFIPAIGNGSSIVGPARVFKKKLNTQVVGFETIQSAVGYGMLHPGKYKRLFGIAPGTLKRHNLPGTSFQGIKFPHLKTAVEEKLLDESILISGKKLDGEMKKKVGKNLTSDLPHWDSVKYKNFGRTSNAGLAVALKLAESVENKNFLIIGYDKAERYDK